GSQKRSGRARSSRPPSRRSRTSRSALRAGAATGSSPTPTSSGGTATTGCTNVTCSGHDPAAGTWYSSNREAARRRSDRHASLHRSLFGAVAAEDRDLPGLPGEQSVERAGEQAARGEEL